MSGEEDDPTESGEHVRGSSSVVQRLSPEDDARALKAKFRELGFDRPPRARMLLTWGATFLVAQALIAVSLSATSPTAAIVAAFLAAPLTIAMATQAHTASHNALTGSQRLDRLVMLASMPFGGLLSARYWIHSHVQVHHPAPNVIGHDDDCDLRPLFCLNDADLENVSPRLRWLFRYQIVWLVLLLPLNGLSMQRQGLAYWFGELRSDKRSRRGWGADGLAMLLHVVVRIVVPFVLHVPVTRIATAYAVWVVTSGLTMFAVLGPGHYPHAARVLSPAERRAGSFWLRQTATTVNFRTGMLGALLCSGLEYQIEHHLFPSYCHVHYSKMSPHVRAFCTRHGLPYTELGWGRAILEIFRTFATPKSVVSDVLSLRFPPTDTSVDDALSERRSA